MTPFDRCRRLFLGFVVLVSFVVFRFVRPMLRVAGDASRVVNDDRLENQLRANLVEG